MPNTKEPKQKDKYAPSRLFKSKGNISSPEDAIEAKRRWNKEIFLASVAMFFVFLIVVVISSLIFFSIHESGGTDAVTATQNAVSQVYENNNIHDESGELSFFKLLFRNLLAMIAIFAMGFLPFVFVPIIGIGNNAVLIGKIVAVFASMSVPPTVVLAGILPHGIMEIPAMCLSAGMGCILCLELVRAARDSKKPSFAFSEYVKRGLVLFAVIVIPLTVAAAAVETYASGNIMMWVAQSLL